MASGSAVLRGHPRGVRDRAALLLGEDRDLRPYWDAIIAGTWPDLPYPEALVQALGGVAALAKTCLDELTRLALHQATPATAQQVSAHLARLAAATDTAEQADQASGS